MPTISPSLYRAPGTSLHRQLYLVVRDQILQHVWPPGTALPTEESLCQTFNVSRITVRRALADLVTDKLVERRHGLGTFVLGQVTPSRPQATLSFIGELRESVADTKVQVIEFERSVAPRTVATLLQLAPEEIALHAVRLRHISDTPLMLTDAWIPQRFGKKVTKAALQKHPLYEILMAQGVQFGRVVQEFSCEAADPRRASLLQTEVGAPLIRFVRLIHDAESRPVQYIVVHLSPERSRILMDIPGNAINTLSAGQVVHDGVSMSGASPGK